MERSGFYFELYLNLYMRFGIFYLVVQEIHTLIEIASLSFVFVSLPSFLMTASPPLGNSIEKRGRACIYSSSQIPSLHHNHWWLGHMKLVDDLSPILPWLLHRSSISNIQRTPKYSAVMFYVGHLYLFRCKEEQCPSAGPGGGYYDSVPLLHCQLIYVLIIICCWYNFLGGGSSLDIDQILSSILCQVAGQSQVQVAAAPTSSVLKVTTWSIKTSLKSRLF